MSRLAKLIIHYAKSIRLRGGIISKTCTWASKVLGLSESADAEKIRKAYHKLALIWHLDEWSSKSQEERNIATEKFKETSVMYGILAGEIKEEFTSQQPNDDWCKKWSDSYFSKGEKDLFDALFRQDLTKTKTL